MHDANEEMARATEKTDFVMNAINPAVRMVNRFGQVGIAIFAGWLLLNGRMSVGVFQAFFQYLNRRREPITEAAYVLNSMQSAPGLRRAYLRMLDELEMERDPQAPEEVKSAKGLVKFHNVRFGYTPEKILMENISFTARPGQKIAIVGATGAGKTTLINLLMRFYEVNGGRITLDGVDTAAMTRENLRSNFGMVLQGHLAVRRHHRGEHRLRQAGRHHGGDRRGGKSGRVDFFVRTCPVVTIPSWATTRRTSR